AVVGTGKLLWPVPGAVITQYFWAGHLAIDMATDAGNPVLAAGSGVVLSAGWRSNGGGLVIEIDHGRGLHTLYNHLGAILVSPGGSRASRRPRRGRRRQGREHRARGRGRDDHAVGLPPGAAFPRRTRWTWWAAALARPGRRRSGAPRSARDGRAR